jgi:hypothetical protein
MGKNGYNNLYQVSRCLDLLNSHDRCYFLLNVGYAFQLLKRMTDSVSDVPGRCAMFFDKESLDKKRRLYFYVDKVVKHIRDFCSYSAGQRMNLSAI